MEAEALPDLRNDIVVIVPTVGDGRRLDRCLRSLRAIDHPRLHSIVVVDNSRDRSASSWVDPTSAQPRESVVHEPEPGIPFARNAGLRMAVESGASFMACVDDDEEVSPQWFDQLVGAAERFRAQVVGGPVVPVAGPQARSWLHESGFFDRPRAATGTDLTSAMKPPSHLQQLLMRLRGATRLPVIATNNSLVSVNLAQQLGGFDERLRHTGGSDREFFERVADEGATMVWCDEAVVYEHIPAERQRVGWLLQRSFRYGNNAAILARRRRVGRLDLLAFCVLSVAYGLVSGVLRLPRGRAGVLASARVVARGLGGILGLAGLRYEEYRRSE